MSEGLKANKFLRILHVSKLFLLPPSSIVIVLKGEGTLCCYLLNEQTLTLYRN